MTRKNKLPTAAAVVPFEAIRTPAEGLPLDTQKRFAVLFIQANEHMAAYPEARSAAFAQQWFNYTVTLGLVEQAEAGRRDERIAWIDARLSSLDAERSALDAERSELDAERTMHAQDTPGYGIGDEPVFTEGCQIESPLGSGTAPCMHGTLRYHDGLPYVQSPYTGKEHLINLDCWILVD